MGLNQFMQKYTAHKADTIDMEDMTDMKYTNDMADMIEYRPFLALYEIETGSLSILNGKLNCIYF